MWSPTVDTSVAMAQVDCRCEPLKETISYIRRRKSFDGRGRLNLARNSFSNSPKGWLQPIPSNALQAPRVGEGVGRRAEEENRIIARGNAIRHYKGVVIDPVAARLGRRYCRRDCERSRFEFSATGGRPTCAAVGSRCVGGARIFGLFSESPGSPMVRIMSQRAGPFSRRSFNAFSRKSRGIDLSSASAHGFFPSSEK